MKLDKNTALIGAALLVGGYFFMKNKDKWFGGGIPSGTLVPDMGGIDQPPSLNTVPAQVHNNINNQLMTCLSNAENDPRAQPNCIAHARYAHAMAAGGISIQSGGRSIKVGPSGISITGGGSKKVVITKVVHHKHVHKWTPDRRHWWSAKYKRWRPHHDRDDDDDDDRWDRPGWPGHGGGGWRPPKPKPPRGGGWLRPGRCWRFWWWHWGSCGPRGYPWWKPRHHRQRHHWSHDHRSWWDDRWHRWRPHHEHDHDRGPSAHDQTKGEYERWQRTASDTDVARQYGLTPYKDDWGIESMRGLSARVLYR